MAVSLFIFFYTAHTCMWESVFCKGTWNWFILKAKGKQGLKENKSSVDTGLLQVFYCNWTMWFFKGIHSLNSGSPNNHNNKTINFQFDFPVVNLRLLVKSISSAGIWIEWYESSSQCFWYHWITNFNLLIIKSICNVVYFHGAFGSLQTPVLIHCIYGREQQTTFIQM